MKYLCSSVIICCGVLAVGASAQNGPQYGDPYYRGDRSDRGGYSQPAYGYGYGSNQQFLVNRVMTDLDQAARRARLDEHEVNHFNEVARSLQDFQSKWARGKFDSGKLDKAIHNLEHLAEADRVRGRDREMLARDLYDLREFRASRGRW
jgi:hypothetical protein